MKSSDSPLTRSIGLSGIVLWLIAIGAVIAIGAAFSAGRYALGVTGIVFYLVAAWGSYRIWRARQEAGTKPGGSP